MPKAATRFPKRIFGSVIELQLSPDIKKVTKPKKHFAYEISVTWTDSTARTVYRSFDDIHEFCTSLLTIDDRALDIPKLAGRKTFERSTTQNFALKHLSKVRDFIECLLKLPPYIQQGDLFIWFWEPRSEDMIVEIPQYSLPPSRLLRQTVVIDEREEEQDYICICTALSPFDGKMSPDYSGTKKGLPIKDGDVIYVLGMSDCPTGYWMVRNVFGSEGYVPIANVRVDQDILQRKKLRMSRRQSASQQLSTAKSADNLAHTRTRKSCSVMDLQHRMPSRLGSTFSPTTERSYRVHEPALQFVEPARPYNLRMRRPHYSGHSGPGYNGIGNRTLWSHEESLTSYNNAIDRRETDDLIRTLHETSMMLQERMVRSEHSNFKKREFEESIARPPRQSANFNRSPIKRVRVSGRFKRMSPSPTKYISPCRRGIGKLRIQPKSSPLTAESPSQIMDLDQSPSTSGVKRSPAPAAASPNKKKCLDEGDEDKENAEKTPVKKDQDSGVMSGESKAEEPRRRRSEVARRVSMRLKQVFHSPARTRNTVRRVRTPRK